MHIYFCFEWPLVEIILELYVLKISGLATINIYYYFLAQMGALNTPELEAVDPPGKNQ